MTTDATSADTTFHIDVPSVFRPLPLAGDEEEWDRELDAMAADLMPEGSPELRQTWIEFNKALVATLVGADTRYAGLCCLREGDSISPASLIVSVPQLSSDDPQVASAGIVQILGPGAGGDARVLNLPCGPAAVVVRERGLRLPDPAELGISSTRAGTGGGNIPIREAQMYIPYQPWQRMVLIALSTPAVDDWDAYARIFIRIGRSVRFAAAQAAAPAQ